MAVYRPNSYSQSDNGHPGLLSSPAQRGARCGMISTGRKAKTQLEGT